MTPEERAVIEAAYRVSAHWDLPDNPRFAQALADLDEALADLDRRDVHGVIGKPVRVSALAMPEVPDQEADAFLDAIQGDGHGHAATDCPD